MSELVKGDKLFFFGFSDPDVGEPIRCADGKAYKYKYDGDSDFRLGGETDVVGYLVQVKNGMVTIKSAIHSFGGCPVPPAFVQIVPDCDVFETPITTFLKKFVKK
jgi:hypothetical protein